MGVPTLFRLVLVSCTIVQLCNGYEERESSDSETQMYLYKENSVRCF